MMIDKNQIAATDQEDSENSPRLLRKPELTPHQDALLSFDADHVGNAEAVHFLYGDIIRYSESLGWLVWNGKYWERNKHDVRKKVADTLQQRKALAYLMNREGVLKRSYRDTSNIQGTMTQLEALVRVELEDFDKKDDYLPAANGVIDLRSGRLLQHDPKMGFTFVSPVKYNPEADYSSWVQFLQNSVSGGEEALEALQMFVGYMFTGHTKEEKLLYISGPTRSGKGTFTETLHGLLPEPIAQEKSINTFTAKRDEDVNNFDLASLRGARLVFASESARYQTLNAAKIKTMTGGNKITAAHKGKDGFSFKPKFKICLTSNFEVNADVDDDAIWGRLIAITFPNSHLGQEDLTLKEQFSSDKAKEGVLRWVVEGSIKWYQRGRLFIPDSLKSNLQEQRSKLDTVAMWIDECIVIDPTAFITSADVRHSYESWCKDNGVEPKRARFFVEALKKRLPDVEQEIRRVPGSNKDKQRGFVGITLATDSHRAVESYN